MELKEKIKEKSLVERVPPQNIEAEMAVLGSMLIEEEAINEVVDMIDEASFYKNAHQKIFISILSLLP